MIDIRAVASRYESYVKDVRWHFHRHPETSTNEVETSAFIKSELTKMGIAWRSCGFETGVLAEIQGRAPGKTILLRADMDALSIEEATGCVNASQNCGVMHACGHDCHMAMLLGAAKILNELKTEFAGSVRLAFQPAEEIGRGAESMVENGAMDGVDGVFGMHIWPALKTGTVSLESGPRMASADLFHIDVLGKSGHGAAPHLAHDALTTACEIVQSLQTIVSREIDPCETAVLTVGKMTSGTRFNIVAQSASMEGTTRTFSQAVREHLDRSISQIAKSVAQAHGCTANVRYEYVTAPVINECGFTTLAQNCARKVLGENSLVEAAKSMVGEDFSIFLSKAPGAFAFLGVRGESAASAESLHSASFLPDENALILGSMLSAQVALDFLNQAS